MEGAKPQIVAPTSDIKNKVLENKGKLIPFLGKASILLSISEHVPGSLQRFKPARRLTNTVKLDRVQLFGLTDSSSTIQIDSQMIPLLHGIRIPHLKKSWNRNHTL